MSDKDESLIRTFSMVMDKNEKIAELTSKVAELEAERDKALDMIRDRLDADPSTMTEAVDGLIKLYKMEFDERFELQAQLDRATSESLQMRLPKVWEIQTGEGVSIGLRYENGAMSATEYTEDESGNFEHWRTIELEEHTGSTDQLERKPAEPRPVEGGKRGEICDECGIDADIVTERLMQAQERNNELTLELLKSGNAYAELAKGLLTDEPRPMGEAPRDGTWALVAVQVRPDKHRWMTAHYDVKLKSWIEGGNMVLRGLREPVAWLPHTPVTTAPSTSGEGE